MTKRQAGQRSRRCRALVLLVPVLVPGSMTTLFEVLARRTTPVKAYNLGFAVYWAGGCFGFPLWLLGPRRSWTVLRAGRRPGPAELVILSVPLGGAVATTLVPNLRRVDGQVAAVMIGSATVNAVGEELLWRGIFLELFDDNVLLGAVWPWLGFTLWHLAPQVILPSPHGRRRFTAGAALVGAASALTAWQGGGLRNTVLPHLLTDACGVPAAEFRLGRARTPQR